MKHQRKFSSAIKDFGRTFTAAVMEHSAEMLMLLYCGVMACLIDIWNIAESWKAQPGLMMPLLVVASYSLQPLRRRSLAWRLLYWLPVALAVAVWWMPFLNDWCHSSSYFILVLACLPLWLLLRNRIFDNEPFARCAARMASSLAYAVVLTGAVFVFYLLIQESVQLLFINGNYSETLWKWAERIARFLWVGVAPMLFIAFEERKHEFTMGKLLHVLLNWALTPALLIYTVILYIYSAKILVTMSLPRGSVAVMVLVYCLVAMAAQMAHQLCEKRPFLWFYNHFSWFALPLQVLFWIAVGRRLCDYGVTSSRYFLILCGVLMTLFVVLFLFRNRRGYFFVAAAALALTLLPILFTPLGPESVSRHSQESRIRSAADKLGILAADGTLALPTVASTAPLDSADYANARLHRTIYQSLSYLEDDKDTTYLQRTFGLKRSSDYLGFLTAATSHYCTDRRTFDEDESFADTDDMEECRNQHCYLSRPSKYELDISGYNSYWSEYVMMRETGFEFPFGVLPYENLMVEWFDKRGISRSVSAKWVEDHEDELTVYRNDTMTVVFDQLQMICDTASRQWHINTSAPCPYAEVFRTAKVK